jgi:hypothetical protein
MAVFGACRRAAVGWMPGVLSFAAALSIAAVASSCAQEITPATPRSPRTSIAPTGRTSSRLDAIGWLKVRQAVHLRTMALAPKRTALYRAFAADMGLQSLMGLRPVRGGRCAVAVLYLYDNLRDLLDAYPGENWQPLRRLIAKQPSLFACAPRATPRQVYVG